MKTIAVRFLSNCYRCDLPAELHNIEVDFDVETNLYVNFRLRCPDGEDKFTLDQKRFRESLSRA